MDEQQTGTARSIAAEALSEAEAHRQFAGEVLERYPQLTERQRATDLVFGVMRNRSVIDLVIEKISACPAGRIQNKVLNILRVAVYEIIYCPQTPDYAIVDAAVDYAKKIAKAKQAGFVNAVLRQIIRHILSRQRPLEKAPSPRTLPQSPDTGCEFDIEILPAPDKSPQEYLGCAFSLPGWLVKSWLDEFGRENTGQICFASNRRPSVYLRPNPLKTTAESLVEKLKAEGVECEVAAESQMIKLASPGAITALPGFDEGEFTVQDLSAAQAVRLLNPQPGWTILDLCAAPGTKTTQLAEMTAGKAKIVATDIDNQRLNMVRENVSRLGLADCVTVAGYSEVNDCVQRLGGFDCVLIDAPCSNTGVLARRPEVRHRITKKAVEELTAVQARLLSNAAEMLKPQGVLCYSTCSIQPEENGLLIREFIGVNPGFKLKTEKLTLPSAHPFDRDGAYAVVIAREGGAE
jgi:16S rRNA (cytosine967-C5)-methyltransferase